MATLGSLSVGSSVYTKVNGKKTEFLIVHQGKPSSLYDDSCNGTWLLMKDAYVKRSWDSSDNDYQNSDIHTYLNGTFLNMFDADIKAQIKQVKLPYKKGTGSGGSVSSGTNGLSTRVFLLSGYELGLTTSDYQYFPVTGAKLSYFESGTGTSANNKRIASYSGSAIAWHLRDPYTKNTTTVLYIEDDGDYNICDRSDSHGIRPALLLPSDMNVDPTTGEVLVEPPDPMAPHDGHNTNIGNVAYEIEGMTANVGGVAREVAGGIALVNGVAREIELVGGVVDASITITGSGNTSYLYLTIDGRKHTSAGSLEVPVGTVISCYASRSSGSASIVLNGTTVASGRPARYDYEVTGNATIKLTYSSYSTSKIEITEK